MSTELVPLKTIKRPSWLKKLSAPIRARVLARITADGYDDADAWVGDVLTTAGSSPQGFVLRLPSLQKVMKREESPPASEADLFTPPQPTDRPQHSPDGPDKA